MDIFVFEVNSECVNKLHEILKKKYMDIMKVVYLLGTDMYYIRCKTTLAVFNAVIKKSKIGFVISGYRDSQPNMLQKKITKPIKYTSRPVINT